MRGCVGEWSWWHSLAEKPLRPCFLGLPAFFGTCCGGGSTVVGMVRATVFPPRPSEEPARLGQIEERARARCDVRVTLTRPQHCPRPDVTVLSTARAHAPCWDTRLSAE